MWAARSRVRHAGRALCYSLPLVLGLSAGQASAIRCDLQHSGKGLWWWPPAQGVSASSVVPVTVLTSGLVTGQRQLPGRGPLPRLPAPDAGRDIRKAAWLLGEGLSTEVVCGRLVARSMDVDNVGRSGGGLHSRTS